MQPREVKMRENDYLTDHGVSKDVKKVAWFLAILIFVSVAIPAFAVYVH